MASHGHDENHVVAAALRLVVPFVGLVARPRRGSAVRAALDVPEELRARLHTPAGLDIGARTPAEIALSIFAQIVAESRSTELSPALASHATVIDPVCGMEVVAAEGAIAFEHEGRRFSFCSSGCRDAFAANPARHAAV